MPLFDRVLSVGGTVSSAEGQEGWQYDVGLIGETMFRKHLFPADSATVALICGMTLSLRHYMNTFLRETLIPDEPSLLSMRAMRLCKIVS